MKILLTGAAGFIGMHVARILLERGDEVVGIDNLNDYYIQQLKHDRLAQLGGFANFKFIKMDVVDANVLQQLFSREHFQRVIHLAAQAGVRYSLTNPSAYIQSNLVGFSNILECCRQHQTEHLVYASSSSVYGSNSHMPFSVHDNVDHPLSLYAATKKSKELMAHAYSHLYGIPTTGLRYFTVYGPWGRPDMSPWLFTSAILQGKPINIFNHGKMQRDFTYIDDIAEGTVKVMDRIAKPNPAYLTDSPDPATSSAPYRIYNIGNHQPEDLMLFIETLEKELGVTAVKNFMPMQAGDVLATYADVDALKHDVGYAPSTSLQTGLKQWVQWYRNHAEGIYS
ncbi:NAD-dependent epimerase [Hydrogenophaga sp.]|uniref:NAD-dependent epimerase n=1 Tax=Hydrogenophaga sp. TaxID=1904254 RepID=UPI000BCB1DC7|nr:NAD-dependent epimerase [Hydrogenophaga sp.]MDP1958983.1 NAD-dependent epimerase [Methylotenera sp.]OYZ39547.1 MAG: protein CapI [Methylotenera sp. 24-45-7]OZA52294.1 MAG: protein CapI [Methylophilales bacterium 39-45-7]MDP3885459.1 NAD-dependent epimerase [Hydrogenophaga sp.]HQS37785.1 NAD-dependent epimerase [Methylotenera sp.]